MLATSPFPFIPFALRAYNLKEIDADTIAKMELDTLDLPKLMCRELFLERNPKFKIEKVKFQHGKTEKNSLTINYLTAKPRNRPRGSFLILPDYGESLENYESLYQKLLEKGFSIITFDWPGQGLQQNYKGNLSRADDFQPNKDIALIHLLLKSVLYPDYKAPYYVLGHGMGSLLCLAAQPKISRLIESYIHVAPLFSCWGYNTKSKFSYYCWLMHHFGYGRGRHFNLTRTYQKFYQNEAQQQDLKAPNFRFMNRLLAIFREICTPKIFETFTAPNLFFYGDRDPLSEKLFLRDYVKKLPLAFDIELAEAGHYFIEKPSEEKATKQFWAGMDSLLAA